MIINYLTELNQHKTMETSDLIIKIIDYKDCNEMLFSL